MNLSIIDAHTHVQFPQFNEDREDVIRRARERGIGMIQIGTDLETSRKALSLAKKYEYMWATIGFHPHEAENNEFSFDEIRKLISDEDVVGIGECGFDFFNVSDEEKKDVKKKQELLFQRQIELSIESKKPLVIHTREAFGETLDMLESQGSRDSLSGVAHFFTGSKDDAQRFLELGFFFTFGGLITHNRSFDAVIKYIPKDRVLVETDAPFVAPFPFRGKRNEPLYIEKTVESLSDIYGESLEKVKERLLKNTKEVFRI